MEEESGHGGGQAGPIEGVLIDGPNPRANWFALALGYDENGDPAYRWSERTARMWDAKIRPLVEMGIGDYFKYSRSAMARHPFASGLLIFFPDDVPIFGHCAKLRKTWDNMPIANYGLTRRRASHQRTQGYYGMGAGFVHSKHVLRKMAEDSPVFRPIWEDLQDVSPDECGIYLAEMPDPELVASLQSDEEALWSEFRCARNLDKLGLDLREPELWDAEELAQAGRMALDGDLVGACALLRPLVAGGAAHWKAWGMLVDCLMGMVDAQGAYEVVREGLRRYPDCPLFDRMGYDCCMAMKEPGQAERHARRMLEMNPWGPMEMLREARALQDLGEYERAADLYRDCLEHGGVSESTRIDLGYCLARDGRTAEAIRLFRKLADGGRPQATALNNVGMLLAGVGELDEALDFCRRALELDDGMCSIWDSMGFVRMKRGEYAEAERCLLKAVEINPMHADSWRHLLHAYHLSGEAEKLEKARARVGYYLPGELERFEREKGADIAD
jgi:tetratricopeptide (TPR) repeat protein